MRAFLAGAALRWVRDFRVDALRLDATHAITDDGPRHLAAEIAEEVRAESARTARRIQVVAEDERNDRRVLDPPPDGWGCTAVWADDLHHALHALLTGERARYYADYGGPATSSERWRTASRTAASTRATGAGPTAPRPRGSPPGASWCATRTTTRWGTGRWASGSRPWSRGRRWRPSPPWCCSAPGLPLLFMGEEYGEERPFLYFTSHGDPALARAVTEGRRREHVGEAGGEVPDPQDPGTFRRSKLTHRRDGRHGVLREHYRRCLDVRRRHLADITAAWPVVERDGTAFTLRRPGLKVRANLSGTPAAGWRPGDSRSRRGERQPSAEAPKPTTVGCRPKADGQYSALTMNRPPK